MFLLVDRYLLKRVLDTKTRIPFYELKANGFEIENSVGFLKGYYYRKYFVQIFVDVAKKRCCPRLRGGGLSGYVAAGMWFGVRGIKELYSFYRFMLVLAYRLVGHK